MDYEALAKRMYETRRSGMGTHASWVNIGEENQKDYIAMARMAYDQGYNDGKEAMLESATEVARKAIEDVYLVAHKTCYDEGVTATLGKSNT